MVKLLGSAHDTPIFLNSSVNGMLRKRIIPCGKILLKGRDPVPVFLLSIPAYPLMDVKLDTLSQVFYSCFLINIARIKRKTCPN